MSSSMAFRAQRGDLIYKGVKQNKVAPLDPIESNFEVNFSDMFNRLGSFKLCPNDMSTSVGHNCFDDNALYLQQCQKHQTDYAHRFVVVGELTMTTGKFHF